MMNNYNNPFKIIGGGNATLDRPEFRTEVKFLII